MFISSNDYSLLISIMPDGNLRKKIRIRMQMRRWMWPPGSVSYQTHGGHSSHLASEWHPPSPHHNAYQPGATRNAISCSDDCWQHPAQRCRCVFISGELCCLYDENKPCVVLITGQCAHMNIWTHYHFSLRMKYFFSSLPEIKLNVLCHICFHPIKSKFFSLPGRIPLAFTVFPNTAGYK